MTGQVLIDINRTRVIVAAAIATIYLSDDSCTLFIVLNNSNKELIYTFSNEADAKKAFGTVKDALAMPGPGSVYLTI